MARSIPIRQKMIRASQLILLERDLDTAKALLLEVKASNVAGPQPDERLADLYEMQGKLEEARISYRKSLYPPQGAQWSSSLDHAKWMRYALLCRATGHPEEEAAAIAKIPGATPMEKAVRAAVTADEGGRHEWAIAFWTEALRLEPNEPLCLERREQARRNYKFWQPRLIAEAEKALGISPP